MAATALAAETTGTPSGGGGSGRSLRAQHLTCITGSGFGPEATGPVWADKLDRDGIDWLTLPGSGGLTTRSASCPDDLSYSAPHKYKPNMNIPSAGGSRIYTINRQNNSIKQITTLAHGCDGFKGLVNEDCKQFVDLLVLFNTVLHSQFSRK